MNSIIFDLYCSIICLTTLRIKTSNNSLESFALNLFFVGIAEVDIIYFYLTYMNHFIILLLKQKLENIVEEELLFFSLFVK